MTPNAPTLPSETKAADDPWAAWRGRVTASRQRREQRIGSWQENVDARRGQLGLAGDAANVTRTQQMSTPSVSVNQDWPLTKAKIAQLYSQTPEVRLSPRYNQFTSAVPAFGRELNEAIGDAGVGQTVEEILADVINASGIGGAIVTCEQRTEPRDVPSIDPSTLPPEQQMAVMQGVMQVPMMTVDHPVDIQHRADRISPADLLIPSDFTGSDYNKSRWLGHDARCTWAQGVRLFGLTDEQKDDVLGSDKRASGTQSLNTDTTKFRDTDVVNYTQIFYWRHYYHEDETSFKAIQRVVFVEGIDEPVINEAYTGQKRTEQGLLGVTRLPILVLTLTYISDDSLPPSDSTIGRFGVNELEASRDSMVQQRKHSIPIRWFDSNRVSSGTRSLLEKGTFQGFIPTNGPGDRAVGEVARASFPQEQYEFDHIIKSELSEQWQVGTNQAGAFSSGERSASEAKIVQQNFQTRVGQERDKVTRLVLAIAEVIAGHLALFGTFDVPDELGVQREQLATGFTYSVRVDSTVRLDAQQRIEQLKEALNLTAQSGYVNAKPIIEEIMELSGLDPAKVVIDPQPKPPEPVKVSVSKAEDLNDPIFLALLMRTHQGPNPEDLQAAIKLRQSVMHLMPPPIAGAPPVDPNAPPANIARPGIANADWESAPRIDRRDEDGGA